MGKLPFERIPREVLVRQEATTDEKFGVRPEERPIEELMVYGLVNIDKPAGPTSHQVSSYVQKILNIKKTGHSGTLDPAVTGCLPVALGRGTRVVQSLLTAGKEYVCIMRLHEDRSEDEIIATLKKFTGKIKQLPPIKSAVKRQWRYRNIYYNELLEIKDRQVLFVVGCQAGTYIRKLVHDMGQHLGCGANMESLRRTKAGPFNESTLATLHDLTDAYAFWKEDGDETELRRVIQPLEAAVGHLPKVTILDTTVETICQGATLKVRGIANVQTHIQVGEPVAIMTLKGELVAVGEAMMISKDMVKKDRGVAVKSKQVFMKTGTYPRVK